MWVHAIFDLSFHIDPSAGDEGEPFFYSASQDRKLKLADFGHDFRVVAVKCPGAPKDFLCEVYEHPLPVGGHELQALLVPAMATASGVREQLSQPMAVPELRQQRWASQVDFVVTTACHGHTG